jgi:hypothetical protein
MGILQEETMIGFCKTEFVMKLLRVNNYDVERATNLVLIQMVDMYHLNIYFKVVEV